MRLEEILEQKDFFKKKEQWIVWNDKYWTMEISFQTFRIEEKTPSIGKKEYYFWGKIPDKEWYQWADLEKQWKKMMNLPIESKQNCIWVDMCVPKEVGWLRFVIPRSSQQWLICHHIERNGEKVDGFHMQSFGKNTWTEFRFTFECMGFQPLKKMMDITWMHLQWKWTKMECEEREITMRNHFS